MQLKGCWNNYQPTNGIIKVFIHQKLENCNTNFLNVLKVLSRFSCNWVTAEVIIKHLTSLVLTRW